MSCSGLTSVTIGNGVTRIGTSAFEGCSCLTSITIPDSVTSIGSYAFSGCSCLTRLMVEEENSVYHSTGNCIIKTASKALIAGCKTSAIPTDGSVTSIGKGAFSGRKGLKRIDIGTSIAWAEYWGCNSLTSITIPDSVTSIGDWAFYNCSGLMSITFQGKMQQWKDISKGYNWNNNTGNYTVTCTDGVLNKNGQQIS